MCDACKSKYPPKKTARQQTASSMDSVRNLICNILCHEHTVQHPHHKVIVTRESASPGVFCLQPWKVIETSFSSLWAQIKHQAPLAASYHRKSKNTILEVLSKYSSSTVGLVWMTYSWIWSQEVQSLIIWLCRQLQLITRDVGKYFSYLSTPTITLRPAFPTFAKPRLRSKKETFHLCQRTLSVPGPQHLLEFLAAR